MLSAELVFTICFLGNLEGTFHKYFGCLLQRVFLCGTTAKKKIDSSVKITKDFTIDTEKYLYKNAFTFV